MSRSLDEIKKPIDEALNAFEGHFRKSMESHVPLLDKITFYLVKRKGKQIRPMFVFLAAGVCGEISESTFRAASMIELLHTATLVHDDIVDDSLQRRNFFSINALWKNKIAVLVGDYLLSQGMLLAVTNKEYVLLEIVSRAVKSMSEGELLQMEKARRLDIAETVYYDIIRQKTASLIASACSAGAASVTNNADLVEKMRLFGEYIGMAFQIRDDLMDFGADDIGKPLGIDIKEKKMTLPLIYALEQCDYSTKRSILSNIRNHSDQPDKVRQIVQFVHQSGGIRYAEDVMRNFQQKAFDLLHSFPVSEARNSLEDLVTFVTERKK
jgi:octaprenyl-diphosphate synthase